MNILSYLLDPAHWTGDGSSSSGWVSTRCSRCSPCRLRRWWRYRWASSSAHRKGDLLVTGGGDAARSVPTLGLLVLVVTLLGTGLMPVVLALAVLAVPPILTSTAAGVRGADPRAVDAARRLGMTPCRWSRRSSCPSRCRSSCRGLRSAAQVIATATVAALAAAAVGCAG